MIEIRERNSRTNGNKAYSTTSLAKTEILNTSSALLAKTLPTPYFFEKR
jgi:hypothetical protein